MTDAERIARAEKILQRQAETREVARQHKPETAIEDRPKLIERSEWSGRSWSGRER
jgi:hypothetical protein